MTRTTGSVTPAWDHPRGSSVWPRGSKPQDLPDVWPKVGLYLGIAGQSCCASCLLRACRRCEVTQGRTEPKRQTTSDESHIPFDRFPRTIASDLMRKVSSFNEYLQHLQGYSAAKNRLPVLGDALHIDANHPTRSLMDLADELGPVLLSAMMCAASSSFPRRRAHTVHRVW